MNFCFLLLVSLSSWKPIFASVPQATDGIDSLIFAAELLDIVTDENLSASPCLKTNLFKNFFLPAAGRTSADLAQFCSQHLSVAVSYFPEIRAATLSKSLYVSFLEKLLILCDPLKWPAPVLNALVQEYLLCYVTSKIVDFSAMNWDMRIFMIESIEKIDAKCYMTVLKNLIPIGFPVNRRDFKNSQGDEGNMIIFVRNLKFLNFLCINHNMDLNEAVSVKLGEGHVRVPSLTYLLLLGSSSLEYFVLSIPGMPYSEFERHRREACFLKSLGKRS
jgi:hypothetical protein